MKVGLQELIDALDRHTKMRRVPRGVIATGLNEAAFVPALNGIWVEMPGGRHFVVSLGGTLPTEVLFDAKRLRSIIKPLKSLLGRCEKVELVAEEEIFWFVCGEVRFGLQRIR